MPSQGRYRKTRGFPECALCSRNAIFGLAALLLLATAGAEAETVDLAELMTASPLGEKSLGDAAAPVTMIEYASLTCSHCGAFYKETFDALKAKYIDTGKVHFILREFPLDQLALAAVMAARCAPEAEFFPIVDRLFREQDDWAFVENPGPALVERLKKHGLSEDTFGACLNDQKLAEAVIAGGRAAPVTSSASRARRPSSSTARSRSAR